jgi:virginiamycin B lyase
MTGSARIAATVGGLLLAVTACTGNGEPSGDPSADRAADIPTVPASELPPIQSLEELDARRIKVTGFIDWLVLAGGDAWATTRAPAVRRFDGKTGDPRGSTRVPDDVCSGMDVGFGSVWAGSCRSAELVRIDERDGSAQSRVTVGKRVLQSEGSVGAGAGAVWVLTVSPDPMLYKVDPSTERVVDTFPAPDESAGVRAGLGHVWITDTVNDELVALDPRTGKTDGRVTVGLGARFIALGEGSVWVLNQSDSSVTEVDPRSLKPVRKTLVGESPIDGGDIAVGGGFVWARVSDSLVAQIDPESGRVTARYGAPAGSGSVAADASTLWISVHDEDTLWRVPLD